MAKGAANREPPLMILPGSPTNDFSGLPDLKERLGNTAF